MKSQRSIKNKNSIVENIVSRKVLGLLTKKEMAISDLAEEIYGKNNVRSGITKSVDELLRRGLITRTDKNRITGHKRLYRVDWNIYGSFNSEEERFVRIYVERFWNPIREDPIKAVIEILLEASIIKKIYKLRKKILDYSPKIDLEYYKKNKKEFWENEDFRNNFLNKISKEGKKERVTDYRGLFIERDFIFLSLLIPSEISQKLWGEHMAIGSPFYIALTLLDDNKEKQNKSKNLEGLE